MSLTKNPNVLKWVDEVVALTKPDQVVWIDGSKEQLEALKKEAISTGEMQELNQESFRVVCITELFLTMLPELKTEPLSAPKERKMQVRQTTGAILRKCMQSLHLCTTVL